ncbi:hypothetical protein [Streptomyces sp. NBC_01763]|uniref:hypothetical protein n=1 Tax=Streptomyces sp. NBC_01763 TaxID=2975934 RepID=UPI002DDAE455|nr:hypothetical protein [Streptomyces sp. NBC_01763]WSC35571.1 hypothetical protein OHA08_08700 [Streptomyces sp. NBC_01763]
MTNSSELTPKERREQAQRLRNAQQPGDEATAALKAGPARVDLILPSLRSSQPVNGHGFVVLGGCNVDFAARLAELINAGADARRDRPVSTMTTKPLMACLVKRDDIVQVDGEGRVVDRRLLARGDTSSGPA